jgi:hypothetical protein
MIPVDFITALFYYVDEKLPGWRAKNFSGARDYPSSPCTARLFGAFW